MDIVLLEQIGELTVVRCWCGVQYAIPHSLHTVMKLERERGRDHFVHCPSGHQWSMAGETPVQQEARRLRETLVRTEQSLTAERSRHDQTKAELRETESRRRAEKGAKTKIKNRVAHGVCPCCNRTFQNLSRHMNTQHPDWKSQD